MARYGTAPFHLDLTPDPTFTTPACDTIDASGNDDGALTCLRSWMKTAAANRSTAEASSNLLHCPHIGTQPVARILGHGSLGLITTGSGNRPDGSEPDKFLSNQNAKTWVPAITPLRRKYKRYILHACNTGAGQQGLDLLAEFCGCVVYDPVEITAPTGFTFCGEGGISYQDSPWQTVIGLNVMQAPMPTHPPIPPPPPPPSHPYDFVAIETDVRPGFVVGEVTSIEYRHHASKTHVSLHGARAQDFIRHFHFHSPLRIPGRPLAIISGEIKINVGTNGPALEVTIYNDYLARCGGQYFLVSSSFAGAVP